MPQPVLQPRSRAHSHQSAHEHARRDDLSGKEGTVHPFATIVAGLERSNAIALLYKRQWRNARAEINHIDWGAGSVCIKLVKLFPVGHSGKDAIRWSILYSRIRPHLNVLRAPVSRNVYSMENRANLFSNNPLHSFGNC